MLPNVVKNLFKGRIRVHNEEVDGSRILEVINGVDATGFRLKKYHSSDDFDNADALRRKLDGCVECGIGFLAQQPAGRYETYKSLTGDIHQIQFVQGSGYARNHVGTIEFRT